MATQRNYSVCAGGYDYGSGTYGLRVDFTNSAYYFTGNSSTLAPTGAYINVSCTAEWTVPIGISGLLNFVGHPSLPDVPGVSLDIDLTMPTNISVPSYSLGFFGGLEFAGVGLGAPPTLGVTH